MLLATVAIVILAKEICWADWYSLRPSRGSFLEYPIPFKATQMLMDIGVADVNADDVLDIFTTNHNYRQDLLVGDGKGAYRDVLSEWGLDQCREFPGLEIALDEPDLSSPGVYIYWKGRTTLTIRADRMRDLGPVPARFGPIRGSPATRRQESPLGRPWLRRA